MKNKVIKWHKTYCQRIKGLLNISHYQMYWVCFTKGALLIVLVCMLTSCASKNTKMETHPTNNKNTLEALDKFWDLLKPLRVLNGAGAIDFN